MKYCKQCESLCQQCYDDHGKSRVRKSHQVVPANESEALTKSKVPSYPPCHRHKHQLMDLYCCTCNLPICTTFSHGNHSGLTCLKRLRSLSSEIKVTNKYVEFRHQGRVDMAESVVTENVENNKEMICSISVETDKQVEVKEVSRFRLDTQDKGGVCGMVVYNQRVYVVHGTGLIVYCYTPDGSLGHTYQHKGGEKADVWGMSLVKDGDTAMLVISDATSKSLIWIKITDDVTMDHHHTQQLDYSPWGSYVDEGDLMVCDPNNHKIHRYRHGAETLAVIKLPDDVIPWWVTRHGDGDQYVIGDSVINQVVVIDNKGQVKKHYKSDIEGVKLVGPRDVITDPHRGVLIAEYRQHQVLLLRRTGDVVKILDKHLRYPRILYLDTDHHRLYVSGTDEFNEYHVFLFTYTIPTGSKNLCKLYENYQTRHESGNIMYKSPK